VTEIKRFVERLKLLRKRRGLTQAEFAKVIHLDRSYLSQLERGRRPIQPWLMERIEVLEKEDVYSVNMPTVSPSGQDGAGARVQVQEVPSPYLPSPESCVNYLRAFLEKCKQDPAKIAWTYVELTEHFPLNKWGE
jgi:transcriptional regulator with XRE-family HTH domain